MDFLKNSSRISFLYDGKALDELNFRVDNREENGELTVEYCIDDVVTIKNIARKIEKYGAYEWVNYIENISDRESGIISELCDCDCELPLEHEEKRAVSAFLGDKDCETIIYAPNGSGCECREFYADADLLINQKRVNHIYVGEEKQYTTNTGRSSDSRAPFFNIHKNGRGYVVAVGWTGKWRCILNRGEDHIRIRTKIDDTSFRLYPGEKIRTSSIVIMPYEASVIDSHNLWRRLMKEEFSLIGSSGRDDHGPLCANIWGGMKSSSVLERIEKLKSEKLPFDCVWMDAGWFGETTAATPDEFEGDWYWHTGEWTVGRNIHPDGLRDVSKAIHDAGMKFLLWFEPERAVIGTPVVKAHPEYFLPCANNNYILNLGNAAAWEYCFKTVSGIIESLGVDIYRQDFNIDPLSAWRNNDAADRVGMTEIKHINGLYRFLDALLEKFPHLIIDNCASGGRRIDIEMLKRSMPMWRSDAQCPIDYDEQISQFHNHTYNTWIPYSGTGGLRLYDLYRVRSSYGASLATNYTYSERNSFADTPEKLEFIRRFANEYLIVRPYFSEDFYPLTETSERTDCWCAAQFDRPCEADGIIQVFRRENSPCPKAIFGLHNIDENALYTFTDLDDERSFEISGAALAKNGLEVEMLPRTAKIFLYSYKK